jgi:hypothetical protein
VVSGRLPNMFAQGPSCLADRVRPSEVGRRALDRTKPRVRRADAGGDGSQRVLELTNRLKRASGERVNGFFG